MFTDEKINKIRAGIRINMKIVKFWAELIHKQNSNTWVHIKSYNNSITDIRNVFRRLSLRVNRLIRTNYGPYSLGGIKHPGELTEAVVTKNINNYMHYRYKQKAQNTMRKLDDTKLEEIKNKIILQQKIQKNTKLLGKEQKTKNLYIK